MERVLVLQACLLGRRRRRARVNQRMREFYRRQNQERFIFLLVLAIASQNLTITRVCWMKDRSNHWWDHIVNSTFTSQEWLQNFRLSRETFMYLCDTLVTKIARMDTQMRKAITPEKRIALTLWFLSTGSDYRTISHLFGVSKPTVCLVVKEICTAIVDTLLSKYIHIPGGAALQETIQRFEFEYGFPQCAGVVDGSHIPIISPQECPADYYNRKGFHSIILQGTVDSQGKFIDINVGWPGRVHDARVFSNSSLYDRGQNNRLFPSDTVRIANEDVPIVILGDPAYPLLPWLMKAFPDNGHLTTQQKHYNYCLSKTRVIVEHAYGRLKGRWRCLQKRLDIDVASVPQVIAACCVLHNICETHGDSFDDEWMGDVETSDTNSSSTTATTTTTGDMAVRIRNAYMTYFSQQAS